MLTIPVPSLQTQCWVFGPGLHVNSFAVLRMKKNKQKHHVLPPRLLSIIAEIVSILRNYDNIIIKYSKCSKICYLYKEDYT